MDNVCVKDAERASPAVAGMENSETLKMRRDEDKSTSGISKIPAIAGESDSAAN